MQALTGWEVAGRAMPAGSLHTLGLATLQSASKVYLPWLSLVTPEVGNDSSVGTGRKLSHT